MSLDSLLKALWHYTWPPFEEHKRHTLQSVPFLIVAVLPLSFAAYIRLRHPKTPFLVKVIVFVISIPIISHTFGQRYFAILWYSKDGLPLSLNHFNFLIGMANLVTICKLVEMLFLCTEEELKVKGADEYIHHLGKELDTKEKELIERPYIFPGSFVPLEVDIAMSVRGLGYNWGPKSSKAGYKAILESQQLAKKPKQVAEKRKGEVLMRIGRAALISWLLVDACDSILKNPRAFPPAGRAGGGSVSEAKDGVFGSAGPLVITFCTGVIVFLSLQANVAILYFINMLFTKATDAPITESRWEPLPFKNPHLATSISSFWAIHWHSFIRRTFMVCAYRPTIYISEKLYLPKKLAQGLAIIATFTLSGLLHEGCLQGQANDYYDLDLHKQFSHPYIGNASKEVKNKYGLFARNFLTTYSFAIQAIFVLAEDFYLNNVETHLAHLFGIGLSHKKAKVFDGKLRSILGWVWTMSCVMYSGYYISDLWLYHGLINAVCSARLTSGIIDSIISIF